MANRTTALIFLLLSIAVLCLMSACQSNTNPPPPYKLTFKDTKSMQDALRGTWILKKYEDSIDGGLTPKLLEYMLDDVYSIKYNSDTDCQFILGNGGARITADYYRAWREQSYSVDFVRSKGRIIFTNTDTRKTDTAQLIIDDADTVLKIQDSLAIYFVKYGASKCQNSDGYEHLINSKFIAGKYYLASDTARKHHIIFTKCGKVEGAEYISEQLKEHTNYDVKFNGFSIYPDVITFRRPEFVIDRPYYWEVLKDTLRLYSRYEDGHETSIFLVK